MGVGVSPASELINGNMMKGGRWMYIKLNSIDKVAEFINEIEKYEESVNLVSGRYKVNAKSLMGIFSLDLSRPIKVELIDTSDNEAGVLKLIHRFEVPAA